MERENCHVEYDGIQVYCMEKLIGHDKYRYFSPNWAFPFASVDKCEEGAKKCIGRTVGATNEFPMDFAHADVVNWALGHIAVFDPHYYATLTKREA